MIEQLLQTSEGIILLILYLIWVLPWKGIALYRAARRKEVVWFILIFLVNTFAILEMFYIFWIAREQKKRVGNVLKWWKKRK